MTKIDIISGFLGAGKTTLIKKLLQESFKGEKVVLIENEFGEIGIDGGCLKDAGVEISMPLTASSSSPPAWASCPTSSPLWSGYRTRPATRCI